MSDYVKNEKGYKEVKFNVKSIKEAYSKSKYQKKNPTSIRLKIWGASTLKGFTDQISNGFVLENTVVDNVEASQYHLVQLHGSPQARDEDLQILKESSQLKYPKIYLVHRPDEILSLPAFISHFNSETDARFVLLGDLVLQTPFWRQRLDQIKIIPHPYLDFSLPPEGKSIVGSFTSWGEMRDIKHFIALAEALMPSNPFHFKIGGTGLEGKKIPDFIEITKEMFVPHFNVQLYHLNGKKRYGESSGSLHRGISVPIIFEANGMERIENIKVIKIAADDELKKIHFEDAAQQILNLEANGLWEALKTNKQNALKNSPQSFAKAVLNYFRYL